MGGEQMSGSGEDYLGALLKQGPAAARCEWVRALPSDDFGPRALARRRDDGRPITVRGIAIADLAWQLASPRLQALAGIEHERVAAMLGYGRHEGLGYFIHAHNGGPRLSTQLREQGGRLSYESAVTILGQVLTAVSVAHEADVVVGGVRPQDIRLLESAAPGLNIQLRNFGLAALLGVPAGRRGSVDHPAIYRAPEADVARDPASDVFSIGVLFIRLLTGPLPRTASDPERAELLRARLRQAMRDTPLSDGLAILIAECVDHDITLRPDSATQALQRLRSVVPPAALGVVAEPPANRAVSVDDAAAEHWDARQWTERHAHVPQPSASLVEASVVLTESGRSIALPTKGGTVRVPPIPLRRPWFGSPRRAVLYAGVASLGLAVAVVAVVGGALSEPAAVAAQSTAEPSASALASHAALGTSMVASQPGTLVVEAQAAGVLVIDGERRGPSAESVSLSPGLHVVRLEAEGHEIWRSRVVIKPGQQHRLIASQVSLGADKKAPR